MKQGSANVRRKIINAATDLFYEKGFEKASLRDIALRVGITPAAIYYHFRNKEEILYTVIEAASNELFFTLNHCFGGNGNPIEKLRNAIYQHIISIKTNRKGAKIIIEDKRFLSGELNRLVKEKERAVYNLYKNHLRELQEDMKINEFDLTAATFSILGMINWLYHWFKPEKRLSIERVANDIMNIVFYGLLRKEVEEFVHDRDNIDKIKETGGYEL